MDKNQLEAIRLMTEMAAAQNKAMAEMAAGQNQATVNMMANQMQATQQLIMGMMSPTAVAPPAFPVTPATPALPVAGSTPPPVFQEKTKKEVAPQLVSDVKLFDQTEPVRMPIPEPVRSEGINEPFSLTLKTEKPCGVCPYAATCTLKRRGDIVEACGINEAKAFTAAGGNLAIEVTSDPETYKTVLNVFKDGKSLGTVLDTQKDNKPMILLLEKYTNQRVLVNAVPKVSGKKGTAHSIFSIFTCSIMGMEPLTVSRTKPAVIESNDTPPFADLMEPSFSEEELQVKSLFTV